MIAASERESLNSPVRTIASMSLGENAITCLAAQNSSPTNRFVNAALG